MIAHEAPLRAVDPDIADAIRDEIRRQQSTLELIASENFVSAAVLEAMGSPLTNKYAEGYPGKRYYGGCEFVDRAETLAIERAKALFGADHANVQPHAGAQANLAAYLAIMPPGSTLLGMALAHGGHLTHGHKVSYSGIIFKPVQYGLSPETGLLDYEQVAQLAREHRPQVIVAGASAYPRFFDFARFRAIADEVGAAFVFDMAHVAGLVAAGVHPSPVPHADVVTSTTHKTLRGPRSGLILCKSKYAKAIDKSVFPGMQGGPLMHVIAAKAVCFKEAAAPEFKTYARQVVANAKALAAELMARGYDLVTGGTDNHLLLMDLRRAGLSGAEVEDALHKAGITVNKNAVPNDPRPPAVTSGIRIGTAAVTTRGLGEAEFKVLGGWIDDAVKRRGDDAALAKIRKQVSDLCASYPLYQHLSE
ncbi:MAG: serine hydroxymethyltransferase [Candidatus Eisenbacteria bacterium]|uniref:Serine hydroxymethyltransferase n=1 Tax=Eiseniibacteriota bacterium TaxID=2212470 RepID=A0A538TK69_UNCEI|nr:MAG: serine hydroxymethyltransferase [Candidatus Eisenbacteria bacterium]